MSPAKSKPDKKDRDAIAAEAADLHERLARCREDRAKKSRAARDKARRDALEAAAPPIDIDRLKAELAECEGAAP